MPKTARRKPYSPARDLGDHGTGTEAATASTMLVAVPEDKNGMKRRQRIHALEALYSLKGKRLTTAQYQAGKEIRDAFEATQKSPPAIKEIQVDVSPKPDHTIDAQCDAQSRFARAMAGVPPHAKRVVMEVCCENRRLSSIYPGSQFDFGLRRLARGLGAAARKLGY